MSNIRSPQRPSWCGDPPATCDVCNEPITTAFVDGATRAGPWACMCIKCHHRFGVGLGIGRGQEYAKDTDDGVWYKSGRLV